MVDRVTRADLEQCARVLNGIYGIKPDATYQTTGHVHIDRWGGKFNLVQTTANCGHHEIFKGYVGPTKLYERASAYIDGIRAGLSLAAEREGANA